MHFPLRKFLVSCSALSSAAAFVVTVSHAQTALPQVDVTVASPIVRRALTRPAPGEQAADTAGTHPSVGRAATGYGPDHHGSVRDCHSRAE